jgi:hypothetical protein
MELFKLKNSVKRDQCEAMRCKDAPIDTSAPGLFWDQPRDVQLCMRHYAVVQDYARKQETSVASETETEPSSALVVPALVAAHHENEAAKIVGFQEPSAWLLRVYEAIQTLAEEAKVGEKVSEEAKDLQIKSQTDLTQVSSWAQEAATKLKLVVSLEKEITGPLATALSRIRELCKPAKQAWTDAEHLLRAHLEAAALQQVERNRAAQAEAAAQVEAGADPTEALAKMIHTTNLEGVSLKLLWKAVVEDVQQLPDEYVIRIPNEKKLKEYCAAAEGEPEPIPGVRFERAVGSRIQSVKN